MPTSLRTRISLIIVAVSASFVLAIGVLWLVDTRASLSEEIEAASRVTEKWLSTAAAAVDHDETEQEARLLRQLRSLGRVRASELEALDRQGRRVYLSPPSDYKAGRAAPAWFSQLVAPRVAERRFSAGGLTVVMRPDASRSVVDAWDDALMLTSIAGSLLLVLFAATWLVLHRTLKPLTLVVAALSRASEGHFATRLPVFPVAELGRVARAFNTMADRLAEAVRENVVLERDRELAALLRAEREEERHMIARELHDELAQSITAVRAMAGALAQPGTSARPADTARMILSVTDEMQAGVSAILQRLRPVPPAQVDQVAADYLAVWATRYPHIRLQTELAAPCRLDDELTVTILRLLQESMTNVARHAQATRVTVRLRVADEDVAHLLLEILDDGRGLDGAAGRTRGSGRGLAGMRERARLLGGRMETGLAQGGGTVVRFLLPVSRDKVRMNPTTTLNGRERGELPGEHAGPRTMTTRSCAEYKSLSSSERPLRLCDLSVERGVN